MVEKQEHNFCEGKEPCYMNYCKENGCQERTRHMVRQDIIVTLPPHLVDLIGELIETVYEDVDRARNEAEFTINRGYIPTDSSVEEYEAVIYNATDSLANMDTLKQLLGLSDDFEAKASGEEPEIKIQ